MKAGVTQYSLETCIITDVGAYFDAGTVVDPLQSIAQTAGKQTYAAAVKQLDNSKIPEKIE